MLIRSEADSSDDVESDWSSEDSEMLLGDICRRLRVTPSLSSESRYNSDEETEENEDASLTSLEAEQQRATLALYHLLCDASDRAVAAAAQAKAERLTDYVIDKFARMRRRGDGLVLSPMKKRRVNSMISQCIQSHCNAFGRDDSPARYKCITLFCR